MNRDITELAKLYGMNADRLEDGLTLCKQGYESLQEALDDEPTTKDGNRILPPKAVIAEPTARPRP